MQRNTLKPVEDLVGTTIAYVGVGPNREDLAIRLDINYWKCHRLARQVAFEK